MKMRHGLSLLLMLFVASFSAQANEDKGWLGIQFQTQTIQLEDDNPRVGFRILGVVEGSPAEAAGLRAQDFIMSINGSLPGDADALIQAIGGAGPGESLRLSIVRGDDTLSRTVRLDLAPENPGNAQIRRGWIGARAIDLPPSLQEFFGGSEGVGAMIFEVREGSPAEAAGLRVGDFVLTINETELPGAASFRQGIRQGGVGNTLELELIRNGLGITVEAQIQIEPEDNSLDELDRVRERYNRRSNRPQSSPERPD